MHPFSPKDSHVCGAEPERGVKVAEVDEDPEQEPEVEEG